MHTQVDAPMRCPHTCFHPVAATPARHLGYDRKDQKGCRITDAPAGDPSSTDSAQWSSPMTGLNSTTKFDALLKTTRGFQGGFGDDALTASENGCYLATALHAACVHGHHRVAQKLVEAGAAVSSQWTCEPGTSTVGESFSPGPSSGSTPLHLAAWRGHGRLASFLLENRAAIDHRNDDGETPLHCACRGGEPEVMRVLVAHGADLESSGKNGHHPVRILLEAGGRDIEGTMLLTL